MQDITTRVDNLETTNGGQGGNETRTLSSFAQKHKGEMQAWQDKFCEMAGVSFKQMLEQGLVPVANRIEIDYRRSERSGDTLVSCLWVERKGVRFLFHQDLYDKATGQLAVTALVSIVTLANGTLTRGDELAEAFSKYLAS